MPAVFEPTIPGFVRRYSYALDHAATTIDVGTVYQCVEFHKTWICINTAVIISYIYLKFTVFIGWKRSRNADVTEPLLCWKIRKGKTQLLIRYL